MCGSSTHGNQIGIPALQIWDIEGSQKQQCLPWPKPVGACQVFVQPCTLRKPTKKDTDSLVFATMTQHNATLGRVGEPNSNCWVLTVREALHAGGLLDWILAFNVELAQQHPLCNFPGWRRSVPHFQVTLRKWTRKRGCCLPLAAKPLSLLPWLAIQFCKRKR